MLSNKVEFYRNSLGYSQQELADISGISRVQISNIERDKHLPDIRKAQKIAKILMTTTDELWPPVEEDNDNGR